MYRAANHAPSVRSESVGESATVRGERNRAEPHDRLSGSGWRSGAGAKPILKRLYQWIAQERPRVVDESPVAKAMNYLINCD